MVTSTHRVIALTALSASLSALPLSSSATEFHHSWLGNVGALCEGFGIAGAFRAYVSGTADKKNDGSWVVTALRVHATSAAFTQHEGSVTASATVKVSADEKAKITLARPTPPSIEAAPKPDETRRVYLPKDKTLTVPKNGQLRVNVFAAAKTSQGGCALGSTEDVIPLP